jgi:hypothetical protein
LGARQAETPWSVCWIGIDVKPESIGRVLGIGLRVAGRVAGQRLMSEAPRSSAPEGATASASAVARAQIAGQATRNVGRGVSGFLKPFRTVGGKIFLEVTGAFFLLPVVVFTPVLWRTRTSWQQGPDHRTFLSAAIIIAVFLYLGISSFWRARRRS